MFPRMIRQNWWRELRHTRWQYTILLLFGHLAFGLINGTYAPTVVDLEYLHSIGHPEVTISDISFLLTCFCFGVVCGSFICFLYKVRRLHLNRQLVTALLVLLFAAIHVSVPWIHSLNLIYLLCFFSGVGAGNYNAVATTWIMEMWTGRKSLGSLMQALSLMYGVGAILGPLVTSPFVMGGKALTNSTSIIDAEEEEMVRRRSLAHPFSIAGAVEGLFGLLLLLSLVLMPYEKEEVNDGNEMEKKRQQDHQVETRSTSEKMKSRLFDIGKTKEMGEGVIKVRQSKWPRWIFLATITLAFGTFNLCDIGYLTFMNTYMQKLDTIVIDAKRAAQIDSITATAYTIGRLVNILVTRRVPILHLLIFHYLLSFCGIVAMFWTRYDEALLILNSIVIGYAFSATIPAMFTYVDSLVTVSERTSGFFFVALSMPSVFTPLLIGGYVDSYPLVVVWLLLASVSATIVLFIVIQMLVLRQIGISLKK